MTFSSWCVVVAAGAVMLAGCGAVVHPAQPDGGDGDAAVVPDGFFVTDVLPPPDVIGERDVARACTSAAQCNPGEDCIGPAGCGVPWTCSPALGRACTDDAAPFCGCDGTTFYGSSSCPSRPYAFRGPCEEPPPPDASAGCALPDGSFCPAGASCAFGCQLCQCRGDVAQCLDTPSCTTDAGPSACRLPDGTVCPLGATCRLDCNTCRCTTAGLQCTLIGCVDAGPPPVTCRSNADCARGQQCLGPIGCGTPWTCVAVPGCTADVSTFCGCDGVTFTGSSSCPGRPYAHFGACEGVDAGPGVCRLYNGTVCPVGSTCVVDLCTVCRCSAGGLVECAARPGCILDAGGTDVTLPDAGVPDIGVPDAGVRRRCSAQVDCASTETCQGSEGCGTPWYCAPSPPCTRDFVEYCGCDGVTFRASSTCPGRPYAARGACAAPPPSCGAQRALASGFCDRFFGYAWNGAYCIGLGGCTCTGADCGSLYTSESACLSAHSTCARDAGPPRVDI